MPSHHCLRSFRGELRHLNEMVTEISSEVSALKILIDQNTERIETLDDIIMNESRNEIAMLQEDLRRCKQEIHQRDQYMFRNDVTIGGVPESSTIPNIKIVLKIAARLEVELEERDIVWAERLGAPPIPDENGIIARPRYISVRLVRRTHRTELLAAARNMPGATTAGMGFTNEERRFYINERLTKRNHQLFQRARHLAIRARWRYVWVSEGRIFARRAEGDFERVLIRDEGDLAAIGLLDDEPQYNIGAHRNDFGLFDVAGNGGNNPGDNPEANPGNRPGHQPEEE